MFLRQKLKYGLKDLYPYIDYETMYEHYNKHYKTYTDKLNEELSYRKISNKNIIKVLRLGKDIKNIRNNGGGYYNHLLYFENISPFQNYYQNAATDRVKSLIEYNFRSFDNFYNNIKQAGLSVFGSGWVWLLQHNNNSLQIATTKNQDNPIMYMDCNILFGMDVWEHAYYLKHKSDRAGYIKDFMELLDWEVISKRTI